MLVCRLQLATSKGLVAGDLQFTDADGNVVDCAAHNLVLDSPADHICNVVTARRYAVYYFGQVGSVHRSV